MSSSRCFRSLLALVLTVGLLAGTAGGVTVETATPPLEARVGTTVEATFVLTELYRNPSLEQWTLRMDTGLDNVTWTIQRIDQAGNVVGQASADGRNATQEVNIETDTAELRVLVRGTVPAIENYTYPENNTFLLTRLELTRQGGTNQEIATYETIHYTDTSREARNAIRSAEQAIEAAGGNQDAEDLLVNAESAYERENFQNALDLAQQAEQEVRQAKQNQQLIQTVLLAVVGLVVLGAVVWGVYWYRSQQRSSRL